MASKGRRRRAPPRSRSRRGREGKLLPWALIVGSVLMIAAGVGANYWVRATRVALDPATMCPMTGPTAVHAFLVDRSDVITPLQAERIQQVFKRAIDGASVGERIDVYVLAADGTQALSPVVSMCRPASTGNDLYQNSARIHTRYVERFSKPLEAALAPIMAPSTESNSPIMESVKAVCVGSFGPLGRGVPTSLTIASDMIQYSPLLNQYRQRDFARFVATPGYHEVLADCHGAKVRVLYLMRPKDARVQDRLHQLFWEKFFDRENAVLASMEAI